MNINRMKMVIEFAKTIPVEKVDMGNWTCGTSGCIAGHMGQSPIFNALGFILKKDEKEGFSDDPPKFYPSYLEKDGFSALAAFLGIDIRRAENLFGSYHMPHRGPDALAYFIHRAQTLLDNA